MFYNRYCITSSTYIWTWHAWEFFSYDCGIPNILEETVRDGSSSDLELTYAVRHLAASWHFLRGTGVILLCYFMTHRVFTLSSSALLFPSCPPPPTTSLCSLTGKVLLFGLGRVVSTADWYTQTICSMKNRLSVIVGAKNKLRLPCKILILISKESEWGWAEPDSSPPSLLNLSGPCCCSDSSGSLMPL